MKTGTNGRRIITKWEGLRLTAYLCPKGIPTIGYGHTKGVTMADVGKRTITTTQALLYLDEDIRDAEAYVNSLSTKLNANQFDALVSMAFNLGSFGSGLKRYVSAGAFDRVPASMKQYIHVIPGGPKSPRCAGRCGNPMCVYKYEPGLVNRRAEEIDLFTKAVQK